MSRSLNLRLERWQWGALFAAALTGLAIIGMTMQIIAQRRERALDYPVSEAMSKGRDLLEKIGAPPGAKGSAFRTLDRGPKARRFSTAGEAWITWSHLHDTPQALEEVLTWYTPRLASSGWKVHKTAAATEAAFCLAPWLLEIKPATPKPNAAVGSRRYELRLEWNYHFAPGDCQHP